MKSVSRAGQAVALWAGFTGSLVVSVTLSRHGADAALWTANGFLAGAAIVLAGPWRAWALAACLATQIAILLAVGEPLTVAAAFAATNMLEACLAAWLALRLCGVRARRLSLIRLTRLLVLAVAPAAVAGALVSAIADAALLHRDFFGVWRDWSLARILGMAVVLPAVLLVTRYSQYREFQRSWIEQAGLFAVVAAVTLGVFTQSGLPLFFAIFPVITLIAFRLGPPGAAVASALIGVIAIPLTLLGHGPAMLAQQVDFTGRVHLTQAFVAACLFTGVATAGALADQTRLRRLLIWRDRAARAARLRAHAAELRAERILAGAAPATAAKSTRRTPAHLA